MASDVVAALIGVGVTTTGALVAFLTANATRRREQRWKEDRDVANTRREAYSRYLIAQQALRDRLPAASDKGEPSSAWLGTDEGRQAEVWRESGAAEMNARLVASDGVFNAIDHFEAFADAYTKACRNGTKLPGNWENKRATLIEAMRIETVCKGRAREVDDRPSRFAMLPITTERLELRAYRPDDIVPIHAVLYGDPDVRRHTGGISSLAETRAMIERYIAAQERDGYAFWAVVERDTRQLVGEAGLKPVGDEGSDVELGYAFGKAYWGRGYATEAGRAVLDAAFGVLALERVVATAHEANAGSRNVLAKLGFSSAGSVVIDGTELSYFVLDHG